MTFKTTLSVLALVAATPALAQDDCSSVTFADVGWTDITATTVKFPCPHEKHSFLI